VLEQEHYNNRRHLQQQITTEGKGTGNVNLYSAFKSNWPVSQSHFLAKLYYPATAIACKGYLFLVVCVCVCVCAINPLMGTCNYSATSNSMKLVHWPLMGRLLYLVQRRGNWVGCGPAQSPPRCTECSSPPVDGHCTNQRSDGPLRCGFNVSAH